MFLLAFMIAMCKDSLASFHQRCLTAEHLTYVSGGEKDGDEKTSSHLDLGKAYRNEAACREFIFFMAIEIKARLTERLMKSLEDGGVFGIAIDEATDNAMEQGLILYIKFVENGVAVTTFYALLDLDAQDAESIYKAVVTELAASFGGDQEEMFKHLLLMATDGCSSMMGSKSGVTTRIKKMQLRLMAVHCVAHRLGLAARDAAEFVEDIADLSQKVQMISGFFSHSVKRRNGLGEAQDAMGMRLQNIVRDIVTRWLSKGQCFRRLHDNLVPLQAFLVNWDDKGCVTAEAETPECTAGTRKPKVKPVDILQSLESIKLIILLTGSVEITEALNLVSKTFQSSTLTAADVKLAADLVVTGLKNHWAQSEDGFIKGGPLTADLLKEIVYVDDDKAELKVSATASQDNGFKATGSRMDVRQAMQSLSDFALRFIDNLEARFHDMEIMCQFDVLNPSSVPSGDDSEKRQAHGNEQMQRLTDLFGTDLTSQDGRKQEAICNTLDVKREWPQYKDSIFAKGMTGQGREKDDAHFEKLLQDETFRNQFPNMTFLIKVKLTMWLQTAECERGFSLRQQFKTNQRSSMGNALLQALMMVSINGPSMDDLAGKMDLFGASILRYKGHRVRFPNRSSAGTPRRLRSKVMEPIAELQEYAKVVFNEGLDDYETHARVMGVRLPDVIVHDPKEREEVERLEADEEDARRERALDAHGAFNPGEGFATLPCLPDDVPFSGAGESCKTSADFFGVAIGMVKKKASKGRQVAVLFEGGWELGNVYMQEKSRMSKGLYSISLAGKRGQRGQRVYYDLKKETYGKRWVVVNMAEVESGSECESD